MKLSLYVHIPFCKRKCLYCDFASFANKEKFIPNYIEALKKETSYYAEYLNKPHVKTVFIGGGTPTFLPDEHLRTLMNMIDTNFTLDDDIEFTVEANPGTVTRPKLRLLKALGVNRISLGVQSFDNKHLKGLGRIHLKHHVYDTFELLREVGFKNINLDLMFALPKQTLKEWEYTLDEAIKLGPEHISAYDLIFEEGTPYHDMISKGKIAKLPEELELDMFKLAISKLKAAGYGHYEISNFAKPGYECRHNITYWTLKDYLGIGLAAHSMISGTRIENTKDLSTYLSADMNKIRTLHKNTRKESMQEMIFLGLRLIGGMSLQDFTNTFGISMRELYRKEIEEQMRDGMLEIKGKFIKLTEKGLYLANEVFEKFI
jgi:oxygen-independent coproporphyrinogen III oxidase